MPPSHWGLILTRHVQTMHLSGFRWRPARVLGEDLPGYAKLAAAMPAAFEKREPPGNFVLLDICRVCTLRPVDYLDAGPILDRARHLCEMERNSWNVFLLGLANYRAGEFEPALQHMEEACRIDDWHAFWPALAMVHHRLGNIEAARERLQKAEEHFAQMTAAIADREVTATGDPFWQHWAYFEAMLLEARETLKESR